MTKTITETTMTEVDKVFQIAARRIQGLTAKVNHWKQRATELEAMMGAEKAARIEAEATRDRALNAGATLRADLRIMSERSDGSEWEKMESQRDGLMIQVRDMRSEISRLRSELNCAKEEWDRSEERCKALVKDIEVLRVELQKSQSEVVTARKEVSNLENIIDGIRHSLKLDDGDDVLQGVKNHIEYSAEYSAHWRGLHQEAMGSLAQERKQREADKVLINELFSEKQRLSAELAVVKDERNELRAKLKEVEAQPKASPCEPNIQTPRSHPVKEGEYVKNDCGEVCQVREVHAEYLLTNGWNWDFEHCTPCDPPQGAKPEPDLTALHIKGKEAWADVPNASQWVEGMRGNAVPCCTETTTTAEASPCDPPESDEQMMLRREREFAVKEAAANALEDQAAADIKVGNYVEVCDVRKIQREPKPGDAVRLVRFPTPKECREWSDEFGKIGELATVISDDDEPCPFCVSVVRSEGCIDWPLSCIEIVK